MEEFEPIETTPTGSRGRKRAWLAGAGAAALALSFLWAAGAISARLRFPPAALADRLVRIVPGSLATFFIDKLQRNATRLLVVALTLAFLLLGSAIPMINRIRGFYAVTVGAIFGIVVGLAVATAPRTTPLAIVIDGLSAGLLYGVTFSWLTRPRLSMPNDAMGGVSRRQALTVIGGATLTLTAFGWVARRAFTHLTGPRTDVIIRAADEKAIAPETAVRTSFPHIPGQSPEVTGSAEHYVVDIDILKPIVQAQTWRLKVAGLIGHPFAVGFEELQQNYRLVEQYSVLTCISNLVGGPLIGSSKWTGVRLRDVLANAGVQKGAVGVVFRAADGYHSSLPLAAAMDPNVLLAISQNDAPLRWEHGFPCRLRAPAFYGVKNAKWITSIEVVGNEHQDFWTERGWSNVARIRTESRIDTRDGDFRVGRASWIAGVAWAGGREITKVEVSTDGGGSWTRALLEPPLSPFAWTLWAYQWTPTATGGHRVMCRATDGSGGLQDAMVRPPHPSGASGDDQLVLHVSR